MNRMGSSGTFPPMKAMGHRSILGFRAIFDMTPVSFDETILEPLDEVDGDEVGQHIIMELYALYALYDPALP